MNDLLDRLDRSPKWLRWLLLLPLSLAGGFVAGYVVFVLNAWQAAKPDAPIVYIAEFAGGVASNFAALFIAAIIAPDHKATVVKLFIGVIILATAYVVYLVLGNENYRSLIGVCGDLTGCYLGWKKLVRDQ